MNEVLQLVKFLCGWVKFVAREVSNIRNLKGKMEKLTPMFRDLEAIESDVLNKVTADEIGGRKKRTNEVQNWLENVAAIKTERYELENHIQVSKRYELCVRRRLANKIAEKVQEVTNLEQRSKNFGGLVLDKDEPDKVPFVQLISRGNAFQRNLENVWEYMMDDNVSSIISLCGMGGVGKTTLAKQVHNDLLNEAKFGGRVYFVTASQHCSIFKLQNEIAEAMKIEMCSVVDESKRAGILNKAITKKGNYVLIIDDVWDKFDLFKEIGVPLEGGKLLVTSRNKKLCVAMGSKEVIVVKVLEDPEDWELFQKTMGNSDLTPYIEEIAQEIVKKCGGVPAAIITMAGSTKTFTSLKEWRDALAELKLAFENSEMEKEVLPILLHSFKYLGKIKLRNCLLYCSLYPEDHLIPREELIRMFLHHELMEKRDSPRAEVDQGHAILNQLTNAYLLVDEGSFVKMHDLIREMALRITKKEPNFFKLWELELEGIPKFMVKSGLQLKEVPSKDEWTEDLNNVSLMHNCISTIPVGMPPWCPSLMSLNLSYNRSLVSIPDSFFENIPSLRTLDLRVTGIKKLPGSISVLVNLKGLLLGNCRDLVSLPSLENLKALRELDLINILSFGDEIGGLESLTNLKCLKMVGNNKMKMIPSGTLKRLSCLQCLTLPSLDYVEVEAVESLKYLEEFGGAFANMNELRQFLKSHNSRSQLLTYDIHVGSVYVTPATWPTKSIAIMCKKFIGEVVIGDDDVLLLQDTKKLILSAIFSNEGDDNAKCILRVREQQCRPPLESLEELNLESLYNLRKIIEVGEADLIHPPPAIFSCLTKLTISNCPKMKKVLPRCFLDNLRNLEVLDVHNCVGMEEIIGEENEENNMGDDDVPTLPKLRELTLWCLPELESIWKSNVNCNSIQTIEIKKCKKLKKVPLFDPPPKTLQYTKAEREWWDSLDWDHPHHKDLLQPFMRFW